MSLLTCSVDDKASAAATLASAEPSKEVLGSLQSFPPLSELKTSAEPALVQRVWVSLVIVS
jgi:hypothetical protein